MARVHWLGAGLSSGPGIRRIADSKRPLTLWNRTVSKAREVLRGDRENVEVKGYSLDALRAALSAGDVVVSMLPAPMHPEIAKVCLDKGAHLVTTSYISDAMRALDGAAREKKLSFINEVGLDPGIDHMLAHKLVDEYRRHGPKPTDEVHFYSYCGGIPKNPGAFTYKFSWSPVGVLRALKNKSRWLDDGQERTTDQPWTVAKPWSVLGEEFEVYPNRDSIPYMREYNFDPSWKVKDFVRGTIRARGWLTAWAPIFAQLESADEAALQALSDELWAKHQYGKNDPDRVVLVVRLVVHGDAAPGRRGSVFSRGYVLDEYGDADRTAMGYLVSTPATFAVEDVLEGRARAGVHPAPDDPTTIDGWLSRLEKDGIKIRVETERTGPGA